MNVFFWSVRAAHGNAITNPEVSALLWNQTKSQYALKLSKKGKGRTRTQRKHITSRKGCRAWHEIKKLPVKQAEEESETVQALAMCSG